MKHILSFLFIILFSVACQKDEPETTLLPQKDFKIIEVQFIPEELLVQLRTGQDELVYFDGSGVFAPATGNDSIQSIVNLRNIDSVHYVTDWLSPSIIVQPGNTECWRYEITFYHSNGNTETRTAFAKYRGIEYTQIIGANEGWASDILFMHLIRKNNVFTAYFDDECLKSKNQHQYIRKARKTDGSSVITEEYLKSNVCSRNAVRYERKFKP